MPKYINIKQIEDEKFQQSAELLKASTIFQQEKLKIIIYSGQRYVHDFLDPPLQKFFTLTKYVQAPLDYTTAELAWDSKIVCLFVNDICNKGVLQKFKQFGVQLILMRCSGYDRVDYEEANRLGIIVLRVPSYAPRSIAEHAITLMMAISRNIHLAYFRVATNNFSLSGLVGNEIGQKTVGIYGTGAIGLHTTRILKNGFGCRVIGYNRSRKQEFIDIGGEYVDEDTLFKESDIISLHCPLTKELVNLINRQRLEQMKDGAILINASRGGLIDTDALLEYLHKGKLRGAGLDVYEQEHELFFEDHSMVNYKDACVSWDNKFSILRSYPNVLVTPHLAFLTEEALAQIAGTTIDNLVEFLLQLPLTNQVK